MKDFPKTHIRTFFNSWDQSQCPLSSRAVSYLDLNLRNRTHHFFHLPGTQRTMVPEPSRPLILIRKLPSYGTHSHRMATFWNGRSISLEKSRCSIADWSVWVCPIMIYLRSHYQENLAYSLSVPRRHCVRTIRFPSIPMFYCESEICLESISSMNHISYCNFFHYRLLKIYSTFSHYFFVFMEPPDFSSLWHFGYFDDYSSLWNPSRIFKKIFVF